MKNYYLLCSYMLQPGSIVEPGNWGRMLNLYPLNFGMERKENEKLIESIRLKNYPDKPSRLQAIFLCETIDDAKVFRDTTNRIYDIIYAVRLINTDASVFEADWNKIQINTGEDGLSKETRAREYWEGIDINNKEILTLSPVEIIGVAV